MESEELSSILQTGPAQPKSIYSPVYRQEGLGEGVNKLIIKLLILLI
jgi:hypothetical protein